MKVLQIICRTQQILKNIIITSHLTGFEAENNHFLVAIEHLRNIQDLDVYLWYTHCTHKPKLQMNVKVVRW